MSMSPESDIHHNPLDWPTCMQTMKHTSSSSCSSVSTASSSTTSSSTESTTGKTSTTTTMTDGGGNSTAQGAKQASMTQPQSRRSKLHTSHHKRNTAANNTNVSFDSVSASDRKVEPAGKEDAVETSSLLGRMWSARQYFSTTFWNIFWLIFITPKQRLYTNWFTYQ